MGARGSCAPHSIPSQQILVEEPWEPCPSSILLPQIAAGALAKLTARASADTKFDDTGLAS